MYDEYSDNRLVQAGRNYTRSVDKRNEEIFKLRKWIIEMIQQLRYYPFECYCLIDSKVCHCRAGMIDKLIKEGEKL
jgi:hypothetical protein